MQIVRIEELEISDRVIIQDSKDTVRVLTVKEVYPDECLIVFKEMGILDYAPEDPENIIIMDDDFEILP